MDILDGIMAWEGGEMDAETEAAFFQELVDNGMIRTLQGAYGRRAETLIRAGLVHHPNQEKKNA